MATRRGEGGSQAAALLIAAFGGVLAVAHVWHGYRHGGSVLGLGVTVGIPLAFALWLVYGGYWTAKQGYRRRYQEYLLLWTVGGGIVVAGLGALMLLELAQHGTPLSSPLSLVANATTTGAVMGLVIGVYGVRSQRKTALVTSLQDAATALMEAETQQAVADETVTIAHDVLDMTIAGVWLADEEGSTLQPVAATTQGTRKFSDPPSYVAGNSLSWQAFETGDSIVAHDLRDYPDRYNLDTSLRSEIILPLGAQGVLNIGATEPNAFDETDVSVAHILGSTATGALERAEREERLREQQTTLEQQNERLEQFASVLSHDLRNPLSVAVGRTELIDEECDSDHIESLETAHERMDQMIDDLLLLAREGQAIDATETVDLAAVVRDAWAVVDSEASLSVECEGGELTADRGRLAQLFENLFRNAVEHAGPEPSIRVGCTDRGFFVADDGPGIAPEDREQLFAFGYTGRAGGTGIGLAIVQTIAQAHGWSVSVTDSEQGGARFEVRVE